ncbi:multiprotein bridging factor aMBF1 [Halorubrum distributum]|uniref:XRE family transcriptional regulator n=1 Tax=Halorubrum distributum JCM 13916 TaxID=1230455 RepID=M0PRU5_9EURY|nr:multiprotein bridging factor aMBF1 [Halorubrum arcis]EMA71540.1 XRE family transcriptional regulator [Halorubrum arcis JCM 13916]
MPQCEMCGAEEASLTTTKVEGAELELCSSCTDFGTEVRDESTSSGGGKYSTSSSTGKSSSSSGSSSGSGSSGGSTRPRDMFDDMDEIATDYDERIREARESRGLSQEELADQLNEKASLIRKLERGDTLPTDEVQRKLERELDISLVEGQSSEDADWETNDAGTMTLGDVVKRKD